MEKTDHTFAVCAYGESPYLEACIRSLKQQTIKTNILIATSTPNSLIDRLSEKYDIPVFVNTGEHGITQDWNFAYAQAQTKYVTIAHQDDVYDKKYAEEMLRYMRQEEKPLIFYTDYAEIRGGRIVSSNRLLRVKRLMLLPLIPRFARTSIFLRRRVLSLGSPICCPSVTFAKENLPEVVFQNHFRADEDWEAWERLSALDGAFIYCRKILTLHRIHQDSETTKILQDNERSKEDLYMFRKFWPGPVARILCSLYSSSEKSNEMEPKA